MKSRSKNNVLRVEKRKFSKKKKEKQKSLDSQIISKQCQCKKLI